jgi:formylglycine-generating enzyme required for sulfatase activity
LYDVFVFNLDRRADVSPDSATIRADALARPSKPYILPGDAYGHRGYPALGMSFLGAKALASWLSAKTGHTYRVPTQAEWLHICRAGQSEPPSGAPLASRAWYAENAEDQTHPVGALPSNALGVHDMLGNAAEWVVAGADSLVMGGGFSSEASDVGCAASRKQTPAWNSSDPQLPKSRWWLTDAFFVGVRLVRE